MKTEITINGITAEIELTPEQAAQFEKPKVWKPKEGERYYFVGDDGLIMHTQRGDKWMGDARNALGIIAKTEEECEFIRKKMMVTKKLQDYAEEHNENLDWGDDAQRKFFITWDFIEAAIDINWRYYNKSNDVYFSSIEIVLAAIKAVGEEDVKKYYLRVE